MSNRGTMRSVMLDQAWDHIAQRDTARLWSMATVETDGWPSQRTVVLRGSDRVAGVLEFHTDARSHKVVQLAADHRASLMCWLPEAALQIRMQAEVSVRSGAEVKAVWDSVPSHARVAYGVVPASAVPIAGPEAYQTTSDPAAFAVLTCRAKQIDVLHLGEVHQRAIYSRDSDWVGQWVAP